MSIDFRAGSAYGLILPRITNPATGAPVNPDATPTVRPWINAVLDSTTTVTVANVETGRYRVTFTVPTEPPLWPAGANVQLAVDYAVAGAPVSLVLDVGQAGPVGQTIADGAITDATLTGMARRAAARDGGATPTRNATTGEKTFYDASGNVVMRETPNAAGTAATRVLS